MKKHYTLRIVCASFVLMILFSCTKRSLYKEYEDDFHQLDEAIDSFSVIMSAQNRFIAALTDELSSAKDINTRKNICLGLIGTYEFISVDSLSKYTSLYAAMADTPDEKVYSRIMTSIISQVKEDFVNCERILRGTNTQGISSSTYKKYLSHYASVNYSMFIRAINAPGKCYLNRPSTYYRDELRSLRGEYLALDSTSVSAILTKVSELRDDELYEEAESLLESNKSLFVSAKERSQFHRYKSVIYDFLGDKSQRIRELIYTEIYSFQQPSYDHLSLIGISKMLAEDNDTEHAAKYITLAMDYSLRFKHVARMANAGKNEKKILLQADKERQRSTNLLYLAIIALSIVSLFLILSVCYVTKTRKRIEIANERLKESDLIKGNYLFIYMMRAVEYLRKADDYHKDLRKMIKSNKDLLFTRLRLPSPFETERREFFKAYDRSFLSVFPNFLASVNKLMKKDFQYSINSNGTMPVELRVLSVIRLGMVDNAQIASFLNYSLTTVYTYRSRAAEKSIYNRDEFERRLMDTLIQP